MRPFRKKFRIERISNTPDSIIEYRLFASLYDIVRRDTIKRYSATILRGILIASHRVASNITTIGRYYVIIDPCLYHAFAWLASKF